MLIVDEAHHLQWSEHLVSDEYRLVEILARLTPGVLLLTATPEQLGRSGHFARLKIARPGPVSQPGFVHGGAPLRQSPICRKTAARQAACPAETRARIRETLAFPGAAQPAG